METCEAKESPGFRNKNPDGGKRVKLTSKFFSALAAIVGGLSMAVAPIASAAPVTTDDGTHFAGKAEFDADVGKWYTEDGDISYKVAKDGTLDFLTYRGFQRYHSECHVCHGPEGVGSTYAPALTDSLKTMSYSDFVGVVASGRVVHQPGGGESVMPALGDNKNVMCYLDGIYAYLKARSDGVLPRGRPAGKEPKPEGLGATEDACFNG